MKLLKRIRFAIKYDIEPPFIVWDFKHEAGVVFQEYDDAKKFSDEQIQYIPKVMVEVRKVES